MTTPFGSPRALAAWALVGYAALHLFFAFFDWLLPGDDTFTGRSANSGFTNLFVMAMPVVAVLLAVARGAGAQPRQADRGSGAGRVRGEPGVRRVRPAHRRGRGRRRPDRNSNDAFDALAYFVMGAAALALIAVAGWVTYQAFVRLGGSLPVSVNRTPARRPRRRLTLSRGRVPVNTRVLTGTLLYGIS